MSVVYYEPPQLFTCAADAEVTVELIESYIELHKKDIARYEYLEKMYLGKHDILEAEEKESYKPDNRIVVNLAKYITDTFNGYFIGKPVSVSHDKEDINKAVNLLLKENDQDDNNAELSKMCCIYGHAYEFLYQDEDSKTHITYLDPKHAFVVYDDTIAQKPKFGVYYYVDINKKKQITVFTKDKKIEFSEGEKGLKQGEEKEQYFSDVQLIEYLQNEERQSIFENVIYIINAFNKAISEKANDVDYFADAYLAVLGAEVDEEGIYRIRDDRIINLYGTDDASKIVVEFLEKPSADTTQENLLDRLERLVYQMSMVTNLNSESFANASGVALAFKLQEMENLALAKERKFVSGMNKRFKMIFNIETNGIPASNKEEWLNLEYNFSRNIPHDVKDEVETARSAAGIVSKLDQIKLLSFIKDPQEALAELEAEEQGKDDYETNAIDLETGFVNEEEG